MVKVRYKYKEDPVEAAELMFGAEFKRFVRNGEPGEIRFIGEDGRVDDRIFFDEIMRSSA
jgi:hypothetical protein